MDIDIGVRDKAMIELLYACGLRVTELVNIQLTEVSLNDGVIRVTGKGDKTRLVPMGEDAMEYIQKYLIEARENILKSKKSKYLFVTHHGRSMTRQTFWHSLKKYAVVANIRQPISPSYIKTCIRNSSNKSWR